MPLIRLGDLITQRREKYNGIEKLVILGVSREGFISPKQAGADTSIYNVFYKNDFVFNPARMELNSIALNTEVDKGICSSLYEVFYVNRTDLILPKYLNMLIKRDEFARWCSFNAIGSARNYFRCADIGKFEFFLPPIEIQKKYVAIYEGLLNNLKIYQSKLADLKLVCDGYIEDLRKKYPLEQIGQYIELTTRKNDGDSHKSIVGISNSQKLIPSESRTYGVDTSKYYILESDEFAYSPIHINDGSIALNDTTNTYVISPIYATFKCDTSKLISKYLMLWFARNEFVRYCWFHAFGTARDTFEWEQMKEVLIPIPSIEIQNDIVAIFEAYNKRKEFVEKIKNTIRNICPILIKGAIEEGNE